MLTRIRTPLLIFLVAIAMSIVFWWPLFRGAGFIGGDLYPYFFPQKAFYADSLKNHVFPLWNDLAGFGYPILGESQTGAAYPFHFLAYFCFDLNTAYNIEHLTHYWICFVATALFAKRLGLKSSGALLASIVFTYGWFPPRSCLEWAILTGAWMPVSLFCVESFLQTRLWRYGIGLSVSIGLQLLGGHFHLAFITQLLVVTYSAWRLSKEHPSRSCETSKIKSVFCRKSAMLGIIASLTAGICLAAIQVFPTWELKQRSSRVVINDDYDPAYGHMPPVYISQMIAPWNWYSLIAVTEENPVRDVAELFAPWHWFGPYKDPSNSSRVYDLNQTIQQSRLLALSAGTNKVEAHCYTGLIPIGFAFCFLATQIRRHFFSLKQNHQESPLQSTTGYWFLAGLLALIYATGILLPLGRNLPGFSFFRGPGRYGIVTTLGIALLAGEMLNLLLAWIPARSIRCLVLIMVFGSTIGDLWLVSRMVKDTVMVYPPRISLRESSIIRKLLLAESSPPRLLAPGPNVCNLLGVSSVPWYLGIAPAEYVDPQYAMPTKPKPLDSKQPTPGDSKLNEWLSRSGVTHVLNFEPLDEKSWQVELIWYGFDPFLNPVWGRQEPIYLYRFRHHSNEISKGFPGRAFSIEGDCQIDWKNWANSGSGTRLLKFESNPPGKTTIILTELAYPGWRVRQGGKSLEEKKNGLFRALEVSPNDGDIVWTYEPWSVYYGAVLSLVTVFVLALIAHVRFWHPAWTIAFLRKRFSWSQ